ncbi:hypothetical protein [Haloparvum sp. AD34]
MNGADRFEKASRSEEKEQYLSAADSYFRLACDTLAEEGITDNTSVNVASTHLLQAQSCAARGNDAAAARLLGRLARTLFEFIATKTDDECLGGLCHEWTGDSYLIEQSSKSLEAYGRAADVFDRVDDAKKFSWGMEQEFDYACWAIRDYLDQQGFEAALADVCAADFAVRIGTKRELAAEHVESEGPE